MIEIHCTDSQSCHPELDSGSKSTIYEIPNQVQDDNNSANASFARSVLCLILTIPILTFTHTASADNKKLPLPRFATIKSNEVNARRGPGTHFPVEWVFVKKAEPVEIFAEYEQWRQIRDINDEGGWIHARALAGRRSVVIIGDEAIDLRKTEHPDSRIIAKLSLNLRCALNKCIKEYCKIKCENSQGWVNKKNIWGAYPTEEF
jgi:SH3-like domain-containing protein